ncbi:hypothetical protein [Roseovarius sp. 217]|uniref:hypothetical protein n=1 Tax=Roseovarius sp. (strain 217) TaxID=314264 RepID=UPI0003154C48|nr:hypothetical protein [Roseovarius sp. 217]
MKTTTTLSFAATFVALIAAPMAFAQDDTAPAPMGGQMMQGGGMMSGDMSGMQNMMGMMQTMQQMGPMMEACTEMMQQMAHHSPEHDLPPSGTGADPAPQGG